MVGSMPLSSCASGVYLLFLNRVGTFTERLRVEDQDPAGVAGVAGAAPSSRAPRRGRGTRASGAGCHVDAFVNGGSRPGPDVDISQRYLLSVRYRLGEGQETPSLRANTGDDAECPGDLVLRRGDHASAGVSRRRYRGVGSRRNGRRTTRRASSRLHRYVYSSMSSVLAATAASRVFRVDLPVAAALPAAAATCSDRRRYHDARIVCIRSV